MAKQFDNPYARDASAVPRKSQPSRPDYGAFATPNASARRKTPARPVYGNADANMDDVGAVPTPLPAAQSLDTHTERSPFVPPNVPRGTQQSYRPSRQGDGSRNTQDRYAHEIEPIAAVTPRGRAQRTMRQEPPPRAVAASATLSSVPKDTGQRRAEMRQPPRTQEHTRAPSQKKDKPTRQISYREARRQRFYRRLMMIVGAVAALLIGAILSVNLLFKIETIDVEYTVGSSYTPEQIIALLGFSKGDNLFRFRVEETQQKLTQALPYLESVEIHRRLPNTVKLIVTPASERYAINSDFGWAVLSESLKVLRVEVERPLELVALDGILAITPVAGNVAVFDTGDAAVTTLRQLTQALTAQGMDNISEINLGNELELSFLYAGRVRVVLGTTNELDAKIEWAKDLLVESRQIGESEQGTLDVSNRNAEGRLEGVWSPKKL